MRAFIDKTFKPSDMPEMGEIYRATKQGNRFYRNIDLIDWKFLHIHEFSMGEFLTVAKGFMPKEDRRKAFLKEAFESLQNGELVFVVFSTQTKVHGIVNFKQV